jgi:hypothetical protein
MSAILKSVLNKALPTGTALNMLKKIPGPISNFIQGAVASGYAADQIVNTIRDRFTSTAEKEDVAGLRRREAEGTLTPEERRILREKTEPGIESLIKPAAAVAGGLAAAGGPGAIVESLLGGGAAEAMAEPTAQTGTGNPIRDLDPALADSVEQALQQQGNSLAAGQLVKTMGKFNNSIGQLEKSLGQLFPDIVASVYGQEEAIAQEAPTPTQDGEGQKLTAQDMIEAAGRAREGMREGIEFLKSMYNR